LRWVIVLDLLFHFPRYTAKSTLHIARRRRQVILELRLGQPTISCLPQTMRPDQFALSPFNRITVLEARLELTRRLLFTARLQNRMLLSDH
jgi:hypothetical protein